MHQSVRRTLSLALMLIVAVTVAAPAQEIVFAEESQAHHWVASMSAGLTSPVGASAVEWNGEAAVTATLEYYPSRDVSFGVFGSHASFDHTGQTRWNTRSSCWDGVKRRQTGGGITGRVHAVRWSGASLTLGGSVGALSVVRERPVILQDGTVESIVALRASLDLAFGATFGLEATLLPGVSTSIEAGFEMVENQVTLNQSLVARGGLRFGL